MDQSSSRENGSSNDNNSSSRGGQGSSSNSDSRSRGDGPTPTQTTQGGDNSSSSDDNGPTTTKGGNDSSSSRDNGNGKGAGGASPTSSSTDNSDNNTSSRGGDNQTSSSRDSSSSSSEPSRSSSSSSDNSSTGGGGGAVSTSSDNAGPSSSSSSSSSSENAGPTSSSSENAGSTSSSRENAGSTSSSRENAGPTSSSRENAGPTSSSSDASSSNSDSNGGAAGAGPSSASSQNSDSGSSRSLSTSTSYDVFITSINGHAVTSTRTSMVTSTPLPGERLSSGGSNYWNDSGAVGGTFAAVGIVAVALLAGLAWCLYRRRRAKRMDADVLAAASAAQATTRTPFDDDDDDDDVGPAGSYHTPGGTNAAGVTHPYYNPEYPASPGFHQPGHYAQISDEPYAPPPIQGSAMQEATGAGSMGPVGVPASSAAFQYYTPQRTSASDDSRGAYESVPTDHVYAYNQGPYDAGSAGLPAVSSAAAYTAAQTEPQPYNAYMAQGPSAPSMASGHTSQSADYELAPSHMTHPDSAVSYSQDAAMMPSFHAHEGHALDLSDQGHIRDSSSMGVPSTIYNAYHAPSLDSMPEPLQFTNSKAVVSAPPVTAGGLLPVPITATDEAPPYVAGPNAPVVPDEKRPAASEAQPNDLPSASSEARQGVTQAFGMDAEGQSALEHSEWDPPALSSAWFPTSEVPHQPTVHESVRMSGAPTQGETVNTESAMTHTEGESALVEHAPARLVVRNPSPEEE